MPLVCLSCLGPAWPRETNKTNGNAGSHTGVIPCGLFVASRRPAGFCHSILRTKIIFFVVSRAQPYSRVVLAVSRRFGGQWTVRSVGEAENTDGKTNAYRRKWAIRLVVSERCGATHLHIYRSQLCQTTISPKTTKQLYRRQLYQSSAQNQYYRMKKTTLPETKLLEPNRDSR